MSDFFSRLRQRKILAWTIAYAAAAWAVIQVVAFLAEQFSLPSALVRAATVIAAVGFLVTLVLAWYHGEQGRQQVSRTELLVLGLLFVLAGALVRGVLRDSGAAATRANATTLLPELDLLRGGVAVLPFANLDPAGSDYFSDGIAEEILHALARVPGLRVAARTSSFTFKNDRPDVGEIGRRLRVAYVLDGSVRRSADRLRTTCNSVRQRAA